MTETQEPEEPKQEPPHLPEWLALFRDMEEEAEERYPDGHLRVRVAERQKSKNPRQERE